MNKKLFVGNLPWSATNDSMRAAFEKAGQVISAEIVMDKFSGRSRGFGFVEMADDESATKAIEMWNGKDMDGRQITVNEARAKEEGDRPRKFNDRPRSDFGRRNDAPRFERREEPKAPADEAA